MARTQTVDGGGRLIDLLLYLLRSDYAAGVSPSEMARDCRLSPSRVTRFLGTLEERGCIERIEGTGRWHASVRLGRHLYRMLQSAERAEARLAEQRNRMQVEIFE